MENKSDKTIVDHNPEVVFVENTNVCNLRCIMCPNPRLARPSGFMGAHLFEKICDGIAAFGEGTRMNFYFSGEPFVHPEVIEQVTCSKAHGIKMEFSTNLQALDERKINAWMDILNERDVIILSLDGYSQEDYESIRLGGSYRRLLENYRLLIKAYSRKGPERPTIHSMCHYDWRPARQGMYFPIARDPGMAKVDAFVKMITRETWDVLSRQYTDDDVEELAARFAAKDRETDSREYIDERICLWIRRLTDFAQQMCDDKFTKVEGCVQHTCSLPWENMVVMWNGDVGLCHFDAHGTMLVGNIHENSLAEVWNGPKMQQLRRDFLDVKNEGICRYCNS